MKRSRASLFLLRGAAVAALVTAIPAFGQDDPESLLPPGFDDPATVPTPEGNQTATPTPPPPSPTPSGVPAPGPGEPAVEESSEEDLNDVLPIDLISSGIELPEHSRRPTDFVGALTPGNWGFAENA
ncbi:MAG TPA: hypothetical protein VK472_00065, partial [Allosphingosinicella sp.]|nr:hypothetical protein [Allosphingosinicella sp.]